MELSRVEMVIGPKAVEKLNAARVAVIALAALVLMWQRLCAVPVLAAL